ncbi:aldo/keto reductase [Mangrovihabitans endophyticus]|uniref:Oxidoreductase n=1 Tax=Mangrovihabitans endophyticus TaxID=1751298 RepID=A0A8J3BXX2_9ACTN|nr:aldo/keto reductase [Mangrovihabitans endophyticus]GGK82163.1 oxidoreductase [Mangrovihabitans endophyticus]
MVDSRFSAPSRLGFGAATIGNLYRPVTDEAAAEALEAAWRVGVRYFDTAPHYGLGLSERRLGAALNRWPRQEFAVSTKVGRRLDPRDTPVSDLKEGGYAVETALRRVWDFSADGVRRTLDDSLSRLGLDHVDLVYIHDPDDHVEEALRGAYPALAQLRDQGVIRAIGVGMNQWEVPARFVAEADLDVIMLAGRYTLHEQPALAELLPRCIERGVRVVAAAVFNTGLLSDTNIGDDARYNFTSAPRGPILRARRLAEVCRRHDVALPHAALQFPLAHPAVEAVVVGARSAQHITDDARWLTTPVPNALWNDLRSEGLIPAHAPVPDGR